MKQKSTLTIGAILVAIIAILGLSAASYAASGQAAGNFSLSEKARPVNCPKNNQQFKAKFEAIKTALDNNNYQAWLEAVGADSEQAKAISAVEFPRLVQASKLEEEGRAKLDEARKIKEELGLKFPQGKMPRGFKPDLAAPSAETEQTAN